MNCHLISVCRLRAASKLPRLPAGQRTCAGLTVHLVCACHHHPFSTLHPCTDQVWQRRVGRGLGAVREEERFVALHHHPRCRRAHAAHHHHLRLLLQVSEAVWEPSVLDGEIKVEGFWHGWWLWSQQQPVGKSGDARKMLPFIKHGFIFRVTGGFIHPATS